jgi:hypothetical protein
MYGIPYSKKFEKATEAFLLSNGAKIIREPNGGNTFPDFRVTIALRGGVYGFDLEEKTTQGNNKPIFNAHYPNPDDFFIYINPSYSVPFLGKHLPLGPKEEQKRMRKFWNEQQKHFDEFAETCKGFLVPRMRVQYTPKKKCSVDYKLLFADQDVLEEVCEHIRQKRID